jgi:hypothetical protein
VKFYTGKVLESKKRVDKIDGYLAKKQWSEVQSELTRQVGVCVYVWRWWTLCLRASQWAGGVGGLKSGSGGWAGV